MDNYSLNNYSPDWNPDVIQGGQPKIMVFTLEYMNDKVLGCKKMQKCHEEGFLRFLKLKKEAGYTEHAEALENLAEWHEHHALLYGLYAYEWEKKIAEKVSLMKAQEEGLKEPKN